MSLLLVSSLVCPALLASQLPMSMVWTSRALPPRMQDGGFKGAAAGAALGGLLGGPFGALWGASLGSNIGQSREAKAQEEERLGRMGLTPEIRTAASAIAADLREVEASLELTAQSHRSAENLEASLAEQAAAAYAAAERCLRAGDEDGARQRLLDKRQISAKLDIAKLEVAQACERRDSMAASVEALKARAREIETMVSRSVTAATEVRTAGYSNTIAPPVEDPLMQRFRDLENK